MLALRVPALGEGFSLVDDFAQKDLDKFKTLLSHSSDKNPNQELAQQYHDQI